MAVTALDGVKTRAGCRGILVRGYMVALGLPISGHDPTMEGDVVPGRIVAARHRF